MTQPKTASKFTPGPWVLEPNGAAFNLVRESSGQPHHMILLGMEYNKKGELEANARLIAQAPEMYELLRHILTADGIPRSIAPGPMSHKDTAWLKTVYDEARRIKAAVDGEN